MNKITLAMISGLFALSLFGCAGSGAHDTMAKIKKINGVCKRSMGSDSIDIIISNYLCHY